MALGAGLVLTTSAETMIAANYRDSTEARSAAAGALERALADLRRAPDWNDALSGALRSTFVDGAPGGERRLADGTVLDLSNVVNMANCGNRAACTDAQMDAITGERPWGANNPRWKLYAYGPWGNVSPEDASDGAVRSPCYVLVLIADDQSDADGNPSEDGSAPGNPGKGVVMLRAEAFGARHAHRGVEATVARSSTAAGAVRVISWRSLSRLDHP
jgi:hypothetical protein